MWMCATVWMHGMAAAFASDPDPLREWAPPIRASAEDATCNRGRLPTNAEARTAFTTAIRATWPKRGVLFVEEGGLDLETARPVARPNKGILVCVAEHGAQRGPRGSYSVGPADARVVLVLYTDLGCPYCARLHLTLKELRERFPTQLRIEYRAFPLDFHKNAFAAHRATLAAGQQGEFSAMLELLFARQQEWQHLEDPIPYFFRVAAELGLEANRFAEQFHSEAIRQNIEGERAAGKVDGVTGTPCSFVNGTKVSGSQPLDAFVAAVDAALAEGGR